MENCREGLSRIDRHCNGGSRVASAPQLLSSVTNGSHESLGANPQSKRALQLHQCGWESIVCGSVVCSEDRISCSTLIKRRMGVPTSHMLFEYSQRVWITAQFCQMSCDPVPECCYQIANVHMGDLGFSISNFDAHYGLSLGMTPCICNGASLP
jgi:hypothetical protein